MLRPRYLVSWPTHFHVIVSLLYTFCICYGWASPQEILGKVLTDCLHFGVMRLGG